MCSSSDHVTSDSLIICYIYITSCFLVPIYILGTKYKDMSNQQQQLFISVNSVCSAHTRSSFVVLFGIRCVCCMHRVKLHGAQTLSHSTTLQWVETPH